MGEASSAQHLAPPQWLKAWSRDQGADKARALLKKTFAVGSQGVWSAPGRLVIVGEHTDYNYGLALPTTIPHRVYVAACLRDDKELHLVTDAGESVDGPGKRWKGSLDDITPATAAGWPAHVAGVFWALQEHGFGGLGMDIAISSCIPIASGLSSSAALSCATALAINDLWKLALDSDEGRTELAEACLDAEAHILGTASGGMDQHTLLRCADDEAVLLDFAVHPPLVTHCPLYFPDYGLALLVIDTTVTHEFTDGQYSQRRAECEQATAELGLPSLRELNRLPNGPRLIETLSSETLKRRARHVYSENERVMLVTSELSGTAPAHERFVSMGKALYRSHASLDIDYNVSCPELNLAVDTAFRTGALGARLSGGGFGGTAIALIRRTQAERTAKAIVAEFAANGKARPRFLLV